MYERYQQALEAADALLTYCRKSDAYPLTGKGDINTYAVFAELAYQLVAPHGRVGLLVPSGIASDMTTKDFFAAIAESNRLIRLYDFENKKSVLSRCGRSLQVLHSQLRRRASGSGEGRFRLLHPPSGRIGRPEAAHSAERRRHPAAEPQHADVPDLPHAARRGNHQGHLPPRSRLIDQNREGPTGNPWGIKFKTMFHQTNDAELFREAGTLKADGFKLKGNRWIKGKKSFCRCTKPRCFRPLTIARPTL